MNVTFFIVNLYFNSVIAYSSSKGYEWSSGSEVPGETFE
jgi:hypothetical protein